MSKLLNVYACGGTGTNQVAGVDVGKIAGLNAIYADCSMSDIAQHDINNMFLFKGVRKQGDDDTDGSGKARGENIEIIRPQMPMFFKEHPPAKFNIIVTSDSGGTGAVIAHLIASHLVSLDLPFVVLLTGSQGSLVECENGIKTMKGLNKLGINNSVGIPVVYQNNHRDGTPASACDEHQRNALTHLALLLTTDYHRLDTKDKHKFLRPVESTAFTGGVLELYCRVGDLREEEAHSSVLSLLSITKDLDQAPTSVSAEYSAIGTDANIDTPVHFTLGTENIVNIVEFMESALAKKEEEMNARQNVTQNLFKDNALKPMDDDLFI